MRFFIFALFMFIAVSVHSQNYIEYYKLIDKAYSQKEVDLQKSYVLYQRAININKPLSWTCLNIAEVSLALNNKKEFKKWINNAAKQGLNVNNVKEYSSFIDSAMLADNLYVKYNKLYEKSIKHFDNINSNKILMLYKDDQSVRALSSCFMQSHDTNVIKCFDNYLNEIDSINFFSLKKISEETSFNFSKLTDDAKTGAFIILTHSLTNAYTLKCRDSIIRSLRIEMERGNISNTEFAGAIDRYYHSNSNTNYYCHFMDKSLPIYDIENIDKRRAEIGLYPLYIKYKMNNKLDKLPKEYKYDINSIEQW